jgi:hypothetical protein
LCLNCCCSNLWSIFLVWILANLSLEQPVRDLFLSIYRLGLQSSSHSWQLSSHTVVGLVGTISSPLDKLRSEISWYCREPDLLGKFWCKHLALWYYESDPSFRFGRMYLASKLCLFQSLSNIWAFLDNRCNVVICRYTQV